MGELCLYYICIIYILIYKLPACHALIFLNYIWTITKWQIIRSVEPMSWFDSKFYWTVPSTSFGQFDLVFYFKYLECMLFMFKAAT